MYRMITVLTMLCSLLAAPALADTLELSGTVRDFKRGDRTGGHPDFQTAGAMGRFGHVLGLVDMDLGEDGKPIYATARPDKDTISSADSLAMWYNDVVDVNVSDVLTLTLDNGDSEPGGVYSFSSNAFFPIDGKLFGNQGLSHNYHFTFELKTSFTYVPGQYFTFIGDDDVWVYINKKRVIDLGGVHAAVTGSVLLFDGKAFVEKDDFPESDTIKTVSTEQAKQFRTRWSNLELPGSCPIQSGDRYINLDLNNGGTDAKCQFNGASVEIWCAKDLDSVVIQFNDYSEQAFNNLSVGTHATFRGTDAYEGKLVVGCWVKSVAEADDDGKGMFVAANGSSENATQLDFFFAERHTTESNFRIDTSILLQPQEPSTVSPLYD